MILRDGVGGIGCMSDGVLCLEFRMVVGFVGDVIFFKKSLAF